jgi:mannan endo-1,4-beta-mannosidase
MKLSLLLLASTVAAAPREARDVKDLWVTRNGSSLYLDGKKWKAVGANAYWLGLDENVVPSAGEPYYAPLKASYPTKGRITEAMAVIQAMGGTMIRAHTLGANTGNPLSLMPSDGVINEKAFDTIDWAVYQARQYGIRLMVPLVDNYVFIAIQRAMGGPY